MRAFLSLEDRREQLEEQRLDASARRRAAVMRALESCYSTLDYANARAAEQHPHPKADAVTMADLEAHARRQGLVLIRSTHCNSPQNLIRFVTPRYASFWLTDAVVVFDGRKAVN